MPTLRHSKVGLLIEKYAAVDWTIISKWNLSINSQGLAGNVKLKLM